MIKFAKQTGDTIVEVMLAMTVLAIVLSTAYATSTRSLQAGIEAQNRSQATSLAQAQVEVLRNYDNSGLLNNSYKTGAFCFVPPSLTYQLIPSSGTNPCAKVNFTDYSITDTFDAKPDGSCDPSVSCAFLITVSWTTNHNTIDQTEIRYKTFGNFITTSDGVCQAPSCSYPTGFGGGGGGGPSGPTITFSPASTSVQTGHRVTFGWSISPTSGTTCSTSSNPRDSTWNSTNVLRSSSYRTPNLRTLGTMTYSISCSNAGVPGTNSMAITVTP
jgi:Tfp pilus assembly protein PilV